MEKIDTGENEERRKWRMIKWKMEKIEKMENREKSFTLWKIQDFA